jgi:DNA-binding response OmpR family regulator
MMSAKILIIDDEQDLCEIIKYNLEDQGYSIDVANSGEQALEFDFNSYQLVLLDIMMEGISGFELMEIIRGERKSEVPVIFISAMNQEAFVLEGFSKGADDYIKKPFSVKELVARVNVVIARNKEKNQTVSGDEILLDTNHKQLILDGDSIYLTKTEYEIFEMLYTQPGKVFSREEILKKVWTDQEFVMGRTVDVNITRIRKKLGQMGKCLATRSGYGYFFNNKKLALHA